MYSIFGAFLGLLILFFILYQVYALARYFYLKYTRPDEKIKFPIASALIFLFCCLFYGFAFYMDFAQ